MTETSAVMYMQSCQLLMVTLIVIRHQVKSVTVVSECIRSKDGYLRMCESEVSTPARGNRETAS